MKDKEPRPAPERPAPYPMEEALEEAFSTQPHDDLPPASTTASRGSTALGRQQQATEVKGDEDNRDSGSGHSASTRPAVRLHIEAAAGEFPAHARAQATVPPETLHARLAELPPWQAKYVLALMENGGIVGLAAARIGVSRRSVENYQAESPAFAKACAEAVEHSTDLVEAATLRGATVGDTAPVYQQGMLVGYKRVRSDKAAEIMLKIRGRLKDEQQVNLAIAGKVEHVHSAVVTDHVRRLASGIFGQSSALEIEAEAVPVPG